MPLANNLRILKYIQYLEFHRKMEFVFNGNYRHGIPNSQLYIGHKIRHTYYMFFCLGKIRFAGISGLLQKFMKIL